MRRIDIDVTTDDITNGVPGDIARCPVALALIRQVDKEGEPYYVTVGKSSAHLRIPPDRYHDERGIPRGMSADLPEPAQSFIDDFDHDMPVDPLSVSLDFNPWT